VRHPAERDAGGVVLIVHTRTTRFMVGDHFIILKLAAARSTRAEQR
jgi:hypothetical protein